MTKLKWILLGASVMVVIALGFVVVRSLGEAAAETEASHRVLQAENDCTGQRDKAADIVRELDTENAVPRRIIASNAHYNQKLQLCLIEVTRTEFGDGEKSTDLLIDPASKKALLWSMKGHGEDTSRECFDEDVKPIDCSSADARWHSYIGQ